MNEQTAGATPLGGIISLPRTFILRPLLRAEVYILFLLQRLRGRLPRKVRYICDRLLSSNPFYDLTFGLWLLTPWCLYHVGWRLFWPLSLNVFSGFLLSWIVGGPIPRELIEWLRPRGRLSPSGFPCIELQVASCLLTYVGWWYSTFPVVVVACCAAFLLLVTLRLYGLTHFPHQLVLSAALGAGSVPGCRRLGRYFFPLPVSIEVHLLGAFFVACIFIGYVAYHAESNDVPIMRVPRDTYINVLGEILANSERVSSREYRAGMGSETSGSGGSQDGREMRRRSAGRGFPPMGPTGRENNVSTPSGMNFRGPSYPPAGPLGSRSDSNKEARGLNLGGSSSSSYRESSAARAPRDSLYHLLKQR